MPDGFIYETLVYCGRLKVWRILNLNSATVYSMEYETEELARADIKDGEKRGDRIVKYINLFELREKI